MKSRFSRFLSVALAFLLAFSSMPILFPLFTAAAEDDLTMLDGKGVNWPVNCENDVGYRAVINAPFTGFSFYMPTWNTTDSECTISIYKWRGTYAATIKADSIASKRFAPLVNNNTNWVTFSEQPAGEYLFLIHEAKGQVGVWCSDSSINPRGYFYNGGEEQGTEPALNIRFVSRPAEPFGTCQPSVKGDIPTTINTYKNPLTESVEAISESIAVRLNLTCGFVGFNFKLATYLLKNITAAYSVYEWRGSYDETVDQVPVRTERIVLQDNFLQGIRFDRLPAGEYLFMVHDIEKGTPAIYLIGDQPDYPGVFYRHGVEQESRTKGMPDLQIIFSEVKDQYFAEVTKATDAIDGSHTAPEEYVIPSDSMIYSHEVMPDTWVFTDGLGRVSLTNKEVGDPRENKTLAMFYWTWHVGRDTSPAPFNNQVFLEQHPEVLNDYKSPLWPTKAVHFWNQPIYGYYRTDDTWVLRRQAEMLAMAGVDVVFTDNTNGTNTWYEGYRELFQTWSEAMNDGVLTPKISFMLPFKSAENCKIQAIELYQDIFHKNKWQNLWYYLDGKPMMMAHTDAIHPEDSLIQKEITNFFTFRTNDPDYMVGENAEFEHWGWLSMYPQAVYYKNAANKRAGIAEQITVGVAMNHNFMLHELTSMNGEYVAGRSYTSDLAHMVEYNSKLYGYNFAEQFENALKVDPSVVFVTGWNEWKAGRFEVYPAKGPAMVQNAFPDQCNDEFSRDLEPTWGDLKDNYYYELVNYVRQYKGVRAIPEPTKAATIDVNAGMEQWDAVGPYYAAYIGNTGDRDAIGYGEVRYTEYSGRNDIVGARVARDEENVYFYVECNENITPYTDPLWMVLYIDCDQNNHGWETFDYVLNKSAASADTAVLEKFIGNGYASEKVADVKYKVDGKTMTVVVPKSALGLSGYDFTINFTWTDNVHDVEDKAPNGKTDYTYTTFSGDLMNFYVSGDVAPGGRFKFSYVSTTENATREDPVETELETEIVSEPVTEADTTEATQPVETIAETTAESASETTGDVITESETQTSNTGCRSVMGNLAGLLVLAAGALLVNRKKKVQR